MMISEKQSPGLSLSSLLCRSRSKSPAELEAENFHLRRENRLLRETCEAWETTEREYVEPLAYREALLWEIIESLQTEMAIKKHAIDLTVVARESIWSRARQDVWYLFVRRNEQGIQRANVELLRLPYSGVKGEHLFVF
jgi:hypothetical protein